LGTSHKSRVSVLSRPTSPKLRAGGRLALLAFGCFLLRLPAIVLSNVSIQPNGTSAVSRKAYLFGRLFFIFIVIARIIVIVVVVIFGIFVFQTLVTNFFEL
jgi:hypothetical protein